MIMSMNGYGPYLFSNCGRCMADWKNRSSATFQWLGTARFVRRSGVGGHIKSEEEDENASRKGIGHMCWIGDINNIGILLIILMRTAGACTNVRTETCPAGARVARPS